MVNTTPLKIRFAEVPSKAKARSCESSGSDHSEDHQLSHLLNSFFQPQFVERRGNAVDDHAIEDDDDTEDEAAERVAAELALQESLEKLLFDEIDDGDVVKANIHGQVEELVQEVGGAFFPDFKRRIMARLVEGGFDAGLCKSKWEKSGRCNAGDYEYIDVNSGGTRYIVEVALAGQFTIARPTAAYASLLEKLPPVLVGKPEELKKLVKLMCGAMKKSMKSMHMYVAPWRRETYMLAKWFASHKRTTNEISTRRAVFTGDGLVGRRLLGFAPEGTSSSSFHCRKENVRAGKMAVALE